jgi:hypothetical protein
LILCDQRFRIKRKLGGIKLAVWASKLVIFRNDDLNSTFEIGKNSIKNIQINKENRIIEIEYKDEDGWEEQVIPFESLRWFNYTLQHSEE